MKLNVSFRKLVSVVATMATLFNSIGAPVSVLAQEITPTPTPTDSASPTPEATISPTDSATPTVVPDSTPAETASPTPEVTPVATDLVTPTPSDQPIVTQAPESNPTVQGPPQESATIESSAAPSASPTATPELPKEHGNITTTTVENVDLSQVTQLNSQVDGNSNITTDKADYHPTDVVLITGSGFTPNKTYTIEIVSTDQPPVDYTDQIKADQSGNISYAYQLDGIMRLNYTVYVKTGDRIVAQTTFTDNISFGLAQCAQNDKQGNTPLGLGYCNWIGSSLGASNSKLYEGMATEQQLIAEGMTGSSHTMIVGVQSTKGGHHAYDWLVSDATSPNSTLNSQQTSTEQGITLQLNRCGDSLSNSDKTACSNLVSGGNYVDIPVPDDSFISADGSTQTRINAYESAYGNRTVRLYSSAAITGTPTMILAHMDGKLSGNVLSNGGDTGDSYVWYTITWTSTGSNAMLAAAADIAMGGTGTGRSWGPGRGAGGISGDPYHFYLIGVDGTGGSLDNQLSADAVIPAATSGVTTQVRNASNVDVTNTTITVGTVVHDNATVDTGSASVLVPSGSTFTFHRYTTINCTGTPTNQTGVAVPSGAQTGSADSSTFTPTPGVYSYLVDFISGDTSKVTNSTGVCEPFTVSKTSPTISTTLSATSVDVGTAVHDSSTITSATSDAGGTVTYTAYTDNQCSQGALSGGTKTVANGVVPDSNNITFTSPGDYYWQAVYSGDTKNNGATSTCTDEHLVVNKVSPTIGTTPNPSSGNVGDILNDTATLSGGYNPTGSVTFKLYSPSDTSCSGTAAFTYTDTTAPYATTPGFTSNVAGTWRWTAEYAGDTNNNSVSSGCSDEQVIISKIDPSVVTTIHNADHQAVLSIYAGGSVHDSATVSGNVGTPSGTVDFTFFTSGDCTTGGSSAGSAIALVSGVAHPSSTKGPLDAGSYSFQAHYNGDGSYNAFDSACEPLTVDPLTPSINTTPSPAPTAVLGATLNDSATLSGGFNPTGSIIFALYGPNDQACENDPTYTEEISVNGNGKYSTATGYQAFIAGLWNWIATYTGDGNNNNVAGSCGDEPVDMQQARLSITTEIHNVDGDGVVDTSLPLGSSVHDSATVTGIVSGATAPDVTFYFFGKDVQCTNGDTTGATQLNTVKLDESGVAHPSTSMTNLAAGTYNFMAVVAGNDNYVGATSDCEPFTVDKAQLDITTTVHNASHSNITDGNISLGSVVHDTATITGSVEGFQVPTPTFSLTSNYTESCTNGDSVSVDGTESGATKSADSSPLGAGNYAYHAAVEGNDNYFGADSSCEPFSVNKSDPQISTTIHDSEDIPIGANTLINSVHDQAQVLGLGLKGFEPTGNVDFTFFYGPGCGDFRTADAGSVELVNGIADPSDTMSQLGPGSYSFSAYYNGDGNYNGATAECENFTIIQPGISITKSNDSGSGISAGATVTYTLTIKNEGSADLYDILVTDFLPGGFTYVDGSTSGADFINVLGSKISWNIKGLGEGETAIITYQAHTDSGLTDGEYLNYATCQGSYGEGEPISCERVNSKVIIGHGLSYGGNLLGQVLGASTELPATGSPTALLLISLGLLGTGLFLQRYNSKKGKKHAKK